MSLSGIGLHDIIEALSCTIEIPKDCLLGMNEYTDSTHESVHRNREGILWTR
jgi:hypothetical protein